MIDVTYVFNNSRLTLVIIARWSTVAVTVTVTSWCLSCLSEPAKIIPIAVISAAARMRNQI